MTNAYSTLRVLTLNHRFVRRCSGLDFSLHRHEGDRGMATVPHADLRAQATYFPLNCWWNSMANMDYFYTDRPLHLVFGTMMAESNVLFGDKSNTDADWVRVLSAQTNGIDAHCWLEDDEGNIYDKFFAEYNMMVYGRTGGRKRLNKARMNEVYEGISPAELLRTRGVSYKSMGTEASKMFLRSLLTQKAQRVLGKGKTSFAEIETEVNRMLGL